jgi:hypothetical protein
VAVFGWVLQSAGHVVIAAARAAGLSGPVRLAVQWGWHGLWLAVTALLVLGAAAAIGR